MNEAFSTPHRLPEDAEIESLRPERLKDFIGQENLKENLQIAMQAAKQRKEALDHVLFYGPPGVGKTTLAYILARELHVNILATSGPAIERAGDLAAVLSNLQPRDVLFVDEIHRLPRVVEETLYPAMEDYHIHIVIGKGPGAQTVKLQIAPFTLIGATTRMGLISSPLRDRFGMVHHLDLYDDEALETILVRNAKKLKIAYRGAGLRVIARRARGTPRIANRLLRRARDYAQTRGDGVIAEATADSALRMLEIDDLGLDRRDLHLIRTIIDKFGGGPVGLETLAAAMQEEKDALEEVYEPYLMRLGLIKRTPRGRVATERAYKHLGLDRPDQQTLF